MAIQMNAVRDNSICPTVAPYLLRLLPLGFRLVLAR